MRDEPVQTVNGIDVLGARVMEGQWEDGHTDVIVSPTEPVSACGAELEVSSRLLEIVGGESG